MGFNDAGGALRSLSKNQRREYRRSVFRAQRSDDPDVRRVVVEVGTAFRRIGGVLCVGLLAIAAFSVWVVATGTFPAWLSVVPVVLVLTFGVYIWMWFRFGRAMHANEDPPTEPQ